MLRKLRTLWSKGEKGGGANDRLHGATKDGTITPTYEDVLPKYAKQEDSDMTQENAYDNIEGALRALAPLLDQRGSADGSEAKKTSDSPPMSTFKAPLLNIKERDELVLDDILSDLNNTCAELDLQIMAAERKKREAEENVSPPASPLSPPPDFVDSHDLHEPLVPQIFVLNDEDEETSIIHSCPDLPSIKLRPKKVTFNDTIERYERPESVVSSCGDQEPRLSFTATRDIDRGEEYLTVNSPPKLIVPPPKPPRLKKQTSMPATVERSCYFAAIGSPLRLSKSEIVPIKLHHTNGTHETKDTTDETTEFEDEKLTPNSRKDQLPTKIKEPKPIIYVKTMKKTRTLFVFLMVFCIGLSYSLPGLLLHALSYHINDSYEAVSRSYALNALGILVGILIAKETAKAVCLSDIAAIFALLVAAGCSVSLVWCRSGWQLILASFGRGIGEGIGITGAVLQLQKFWHDSHWPLCLHAVFIILAVCGMITSQLIHPFLTPSSHFASLQSTLHKFGAEGFEVGIGRNATDVYDGIYGVYEASALPACIIAFILIAIISVTCALLMLGIALYSCIQNTRHKTRENYNKNLRLEQLKQNIEVKRNVNKPCLKRSLSTDEETNDETRLLAPGPCALEQQLAKLSELAENNAKKESAEKKVTIQIPRDDRWFQAQQSFDTPTLLFLYVFFCFALGTEFTNARFLYVYAAKCRLHLPLMHGSLVLTLFWGTILVSRVAAIPLSRVLTPNTIMISCLMLNLVSPIVLLTYGQKYPSFFWIFAGLLGLSLGPILPGGLTWANIFLSCASKSIALALGFGAVGAGLLSWLAGFLLDFFGYESLMYLNIAIAGFNILLYFPVMVILSRRSWFRLKPQLVLEPKKAVQVSYV
ncbi:hypothetical protein CAPTEDRAFT_186702 [Capitella teleta]|uniref:Uncharacterized protein n=1 Tax=Capitella teleta TaxID=283909 RepID=R7TQ11_CAPTE|nr:hypothetical protein CAPTEDRAFT_186702 [Capitella teleta]|eukprot:ELT95978.1 hypothetical protein CAPTEDRAFT_186702 [Capitella teleta]